MPPLFFLQSETGFSVINMVLEKQSSLKQMYGSLALIAITLFGMSGCGGDSKTSVAHTMHAHRVKAVAKMVVTNTPGSPITIERGTLVGNFDAQLTFTRRHTEADNGFLLKMFYINTPQGSITGRAYLRKYKIGVPTSAEYPASIIRGTGIFANVSSSNLIFIAEDSSQTGGTAGTIIDTMTGTLYY
jgi:hypothetical protein